MIFFSNIQISFLKCDCCVWMYWPKLIYFKGIPMPICRKDFQDCFMQSFLKFALFIKGLESTAFILFGKTIPSTVRNQKVSSLTSVNKHHSK